MPEEPIRIEMAVFWDQDRQTLQRIERTLALISRRLKLLTEMTMATMDDVRARVDAQRTVTTSVVTLLSDLRRQLEAAMTSHDPNALQALSDQIEANTRTLADAVVSHTPADPADPRPSEPPAPDVIIPPPEGTVQQATQG